VTGMKAIPRHLVILGGGPVGAEMAQAVRRLGGDVTLAEGAAHVLARGPAPLGGALGEVLGADGIELLLGGHAAAARRAGRGSGRGGTAGTASWPSTTAPNCAVTTCSWPPGAARACMGSAWRRSA